MLVCLVEIRLHLYNTHSLKEKRSIIKRVAERVKKKFNASVAETGEQDLWQTALLGVALVGNSKGLLEREMEKILHLIEEDGELEIVAVKHELWSFGGKGFDGFSFKVDNLLDKEGR